MFKLSFIWSLVICDTVAEVIGGSVHKYCLANFCSLKKTSFGSFSIYHKLSYRFKPIISERAWGF